jgi:hypothetical protein
MDLITILLGGILICLICMSSSPFIIICVLFGCAMIYFTSSIALGMISLGIQIIGFPIKFIIYNSIWWGDRITYNASTYAEANGYPSELLMIYTFIGLFLVCIGLISCIVHLDRKQR